MHIASHFYHYDASGESKIKIQMPNNIRKTDNFFQD